LKKKRGCTFSGATKLYEGGTPSCENWKSSTEVILNFLGKIGRSSLERNGESKYGVK
jgi:hypothetical protein